MSEKQRADVALVERGLCESRTKAQVRIMAGDRWIHGRLPAKRRGACLCD